MSNHSGEQNELQPCHLRYGVRLPSSNLNRVLRRIPLYYLTPRYHGETEHHGNAGENSRVHGAPWRNSEQGSRGSFLGQLDHSQGRVT